MTDNGEGAIGGYPPPGILRGSPLPCIIGAQPGGVFSSSFNWTTILHFEGIWGKNKI